MAKRISPVKPSNLSLVWQERAACKGMDQDVFYGPDAPESSAERIAREEKAKSVCASCPVREQCLNYALTQNEVYGIWGGMTERERRAIKSGKRVPGSGSRKVS